MSHNNHEVFPHPVLSPRRRDYRNGSVFKIIAPEPLLNAHGEITVLVEFQITCSSLKQLVEDGSAACVCLVECTSTYHRRAFSVHGFQELLVLQHADFPDSFRITPYIATTEAISGFCADEFSEVVKNLLPEGIDLEAGAVLAIGNAEEIEVTDPIASIFDLGADASLPQGFFATELGGERISINVHPDDWHHVNLLRNRSNGLDFLGQALYLHSVGEALRGLGDHREKRWAKCLLDKVRETRPEMAEEDIAEKSELIAQEIFQGKFFSGFLAAVPQVIHDE